MPHVIVYLGPPGCAAASKGPFCTWKVVVPQEAPVLEMQDNMGRLLFHVSMDVLRLGLTGQDCIMAQWGLEGPIALTTERVKHLSWIQKQTTAQLALLQQNSQCREGP